MFAIPAVGMPCKERNGLANADQDISTASQLTEGGSSAFRTCIIRPEWQVLSFGVRENQKARFCEASTNEERSYLVD